MRREREDRKENESEASAVESCVPHHRQRRRVELSDPRSSTAATSPCDLATFMLDESLEAACLYHFNQIDEIDYENMIHCLVVY